MRWLLVVPYVIGYWVGREHAFNREVRAALSDDSLRNALEAWS